MIRLSRAGENDVDLYFLVGAILGSGLFIMGGRAPARRLITGIRSLLKK